MGECGALARRRRTRTMEEGGCTKHARTCGASQGLFLAPYRGLVVAVAAPMAGLWDCPYVDAFGEGAVTSDTGALRARDPPPQPADIELRPPHALARAFSIF